jgi:hypothetical protein
MKFLRQLRVAKTLLMTDLKAFRPIVLDKVIDMFIWVSLTVIITTYVLPNMGIQANYGLFMVGALISSVSVFETWPSIFNMMHDFEHARITHYYATLPMPTWMVFARLIVYNAIICSFLSALVLPFCLLWMWNTLSLMAINWFKFIPMFVVANVFYGALGPFIASWVKTSVQTEHVWMRLIFPLWYLGGFNFSWDALYMALPWLAYMSFFNPILHATEGYRAALLGTSAFPFWVSLSYLAAISLVVSWIGVVRLKKRLDFI